ncbi:4-hydroxy-tetrahydrodipicolinate reductase [Aliidiomarina maris]|uniref:4-hydroxy-tetrahydrodipicolinate reductase n=2 Tax=Aliidiomarina maris TaxID=531312 RepID=A0ABY0BRA4_9GAMM|nr:4-hydroxy-tetrahydrodipicolinate reductase [Aliidiomarina maris]
MTLSELKVAIIGASGRMGAQLIELMLDRDDVTLVAAVTHAESSALGQDVGSRLHRPTAGVQFSHDLMAAAKAADVLVDFSLPAALADNLAAAVQTQTPIVVCTTGLNSRQHADVEAAAAKVPVLYAANTSLGVNLLLALVRTASQALGSNCDIEILEAHHTAKRDAPSGTALALGEAAAAGRGQQLKDVAEYQRNHQHDPYKKGSIGFATLRAGDIVGEHTVYLVCGSERLELTHRVAGRKTFAEGALNAALWLAKQTPGFYHMKHVLGLDD